MTLLSKLVTIGVCYYTNTIWAKSRLMHNYILKLCWVSFLNPTSYVNCQGKNDVSDFCHLFFDSLCCILNVTNISVNHHYLPIV